MLYPLSYGSYSCGATGSGLMSARLARIIVTVGSGTVPPGPGKGQSAPTRVRRSLAHVIRSSFRRVSPAANSATVPAAHGDCRNISRDTSTKSDSLADN
jgi:hypothetical protein